MPKKSKKSKSKRVPLRKKYKIARKVKEHHKKKAKEAAKAEKGRPKVEKDPGIPAQWPFREQELAQLEAKRARTLEEIERKKQEKKAQRAANKRAFASMDTDEGDEEEEGDEGMAALAQQAASRDKEFEKRKKAKVESKSVNDGSKRAYWKEFQKVVESADVIIQVLDARDPLGSRCKEVERLVLRSGPQKRVVLLLNKIDLVPREVAEQWLKYLREELPTVAFKCSTQSQKSNLGQRSLPAGASTSALNTSECLGADTLIQLLKNYSRNLQIKTSVTVGVVGFPNVGKSSLINSLKRARVAQVGATPGVTKTMQEVQLDKNVKLLDCPGIVFATAPAAEGGEAAAALRNCVKVEKLEDPVTPVKEILRLCPAEKLMAIFKVSRFKNVDEFLHSVALARGKLKKGGIADSAAAAKLVLQDWNAGKIPYYTTPPERNSSDPADAQLVTTWGKEFDVDQVFKSEESAVIAGLPSLQDGQYMQMPARDPLKVDMEGMDEEEEEEEEPEEEDEEEGPSGSDMDDEERVVEKKFDHEHRGSKFLNQTQQLYNEEGIFNPHAARAQRKQQKKAAGGSKAVGVVAGKKKKGGKVDDGEDSDYDFGTDFQDGEAGAEDQDGAFDEAGEEDGMAE